MERNGLEVAANKTEAIILNNRRAVGNVRFEIDGSVIVPQKTVTYLGVTLDRGMILGPHVAEACNKARAMNALMPNIGGPRARKRMVLAFSVQGIILYGSPVWAPAMKIRRYRVMVESVQRLMALRIISAYRTVSTSAALVMAGLIPIPLLAEERKQLFDQEDVGEETSKIINGEMAGFMGL